MKFKPLLVGIAVSAVAATLVASASGAGNAALIIRHQIRGCHTWSVNGGPYRANQTLRIQHGSFVTITNNDVMPHQLIKVAGPTVRLTNLNTGMMGAGMHKSSVAGAMTHMGASTRVVFTHPGTYRFMTKAGEDYMPGMKTIGEDNVLRLVVIVA
jgi:plastocyanin